jgi:hypothetical protein
VVKDLFSVLKNVTGKVHGIHGIIGLKYMKVQLVDELKRLVKL